jgi:hypothetical protein
MVPASLPSEIMFPAHQIPQQVARPQLPRPPFKAIKIVDWTKCWCEIDPYAAKTPAEETIAKVSFPEDAVFEVNKLKEIFLHFWLYKGHITLHRYFKWFDQKYYLISLREVNYNC